MATDLTGDSPPPPATPGQRMARAILAEFEQSVASLSPSSATTALPSQLLLRFDGAGTEPQPAGKQQKPEEDAEDPEAEDPEAEEAEELPEQDEQPPPPADGAGGIAAGGIDWQCLAVTGWAGCGAMTAVAAVLVAGWKAPLFD